MQKRSINIRIHCPESQFGRQQLRDKITLFHLQVIKRRLNALDLTDEQQRLFIEYIITDLKSREKDGVIT